MHYKIVLNTYNIFNFVVTQNTCENTWKRLFSPFWTPNEDKSTWSIKPLPFLLLAGQLLRRKPKTPFYRASIFVTIRESSSSRKKLSLIYTSKPERPWILQLNKSIITLTVTELLQIRCRSNFRTPMLSSYSSTAPGLISSGKWLSNPLSFEAFRGTF